MFKTTTYEKALQDEQISQEILVYPTQRVFLNIAGLKLLDKNLAGGGADIIN